MPTPSLHRHEESVLFNSTCPDDQVPHAESNRNQPPVLSEQVDQLWREEEAVASRSGVDGGSQTSVTAIDAALPQLSATMPPGGQLRRETRAASEMNSTMFYNAGALDDDTKPAETDQEMTANSAAGGNNTQGDQSHYTERRNQRISRTFTGAVSLGITESDAWEPYGTNLTNHRQPGSNSHVSDLLSSSGMDGDRQDEHGVCHCAWDGISEGYKGFDSTGSRIIPIPPSTYLRPGSRFIGTQQSERQVYDVQVEIKHVDLRESFLCGYLRIQGLTEDHPTLTTYFEGEIIGSKYGFITKHKSWGANDRIDMSHWAKFAAFHPFVRQAKKGNLVIKEYLQKENIFMRWKEHFLVPDHRVRTIHGASFEGFYYICFNQIEGIVHGIYFHSKSEKFQQLELKHVEDRGCMNAVEFR